EGGLYEVSGEAQIAARADAVHQAIYLIFNEGYHGSHPQETIREELCQEALRLGVLLTGHRVVAAESQALVALMCFHLARLTARVDGEGRLVPLEEQDRSRWERPLIEQGVRFLERSAQGERVSAYHLEAGIAALHCLAASHEETDWTEIIALYDLLYGLTPTPIVALNRAIAIGQAEGPGKALEELNRIPGARKLKDYPFYPAALGEFHRRAGHREEARDYFAQALRLARSPSESRFLERKLEVCG
ncbi:MAG: hypothetical protein IIA41_14930, partial [SAR324 cluster bacterium]|nr:hypothetical protein [SAR324 cluster bacterium]